MSIDIQCHCGEICAVSEELAGQAIRCRRCNESLHVPEMGVTATPRKRPGPGGEVDAFSATPLPAADFAEYEHAHGEDEDFEQFLARRRRERQEEEDLPRRESQSLYKPPDMNASIGMGALLIVVAIAWFCGGLSFGMLFYHYPPILFLAGVITLIRGVMQRR